MNVYPSFSRILSSLLASPLIWLSRLIWLCSILFIRLINPSSSFLSAAACSLLKRYNLLKLYKNKNTFTLDIFLSCWKNAPSSKITKNILQEHYGSTLQKEKYLITIFLAAEITSCPISSSEIQENLDPGLVKNKEILDNKTAMSNVLLNTCFKALLYTYSF